MADEPSTTAKPIEPGCSHKGKWVGLGTSVIALTDGLLVVQSLFCSVCGYTKIETTKINFPEPPSPIAKAEIDPRGIFNRKRLQN